MSRRYQPLSPAHAVIIAARARCMRQAPSASELALWAVLSGSKLGVGFRRQYRVGTFIADFAAPSRKLIVEVDGGYHVERTGGTAAMPGISVAERHAPGRLVVAKVSSRQVPLPNDWPEYSKRGFLAAVALAHRAMVFAHSWCVNSRIARVRLAAENVALRARVALLQEQMRIKDARLMHIPPQCRPHYPPTERLAILALKASQGWNNAQTARALLVTAETVARWLARLDGEGKEALVALPTPVNRFPDFVAMLVKQLKTSCPVMGKKRIADTLARAGLHLSASTVARFLKRELAKPTDANTPSPAKPSTPTSNGCPATRTAPKRIVTARHAGHVWHVDLTAVPICFGFWIPWFPYSWAQHWPFCFWVAVVVDHFSRKAILLRCFRGTPSALDVTETLDIAITTVGRTPKYIISDQGAQFREDYRDWCQLRGIKPRFGAIGQHGSIAVVERFIRTLKQECARQIIAPLATDAFEHELLTYALWYNEHRPHRTLQGRTPNEVADGRLAAIDRPRIEVRHKPKERSEPSSDGEVEQVTNASRLRLVVTHFEGRRHLPLVSLERAA